MTIDSSDFATLLPVVLVFAVVFTAISLWRRRVPGLTGTTSIRATIYLARYAAGLEYYGLRRREISAHVDELRADLAAAAEAGNTGSLDRLSPPRTLAAEVTRHLLRPSWLRGLLWAGVVALTTLVGTMLLTEAFLGGFEPLAHPAQHGEWSGLGFTVEATMGDDGRASTIGFGSVWLFAAPLIAFVLGSRAWRALSRGGAAEQS